MILTRITMKGDQLNYNPNNNIFEDERIKIINKMVDKNTVYIDMILEPNEYNSCPSCMSNNVVKNGHKLLFPIIEIVPHYKNVCRLFVQRFKCNICGKSFLDESKLTFKNKQISKSTIFQILLDLREDISFTYIAKKNNVEIVIFGDINRLSFSIGKSNKCVVAILDEGLGNKILEMVKELKGANN